MSLYSTVDRGGIIIDLTDLASVNHNKENHQATLTGGVATKAVAVELAKDGFCTTLPSINPCGAIPFFLNGGNSPLVSKLGYASDNIISARVITASGEFITVSEDENSDLLYAIRGAGQYFGLVISLTVRTYPVDEVLGNEDGSLWSGRFVYPLESANEVAEVMEGIVNNREYCTGGLIMIAALPPAWKPAVVVTARLIAQDSDSLQHKAFKPLYDLKPQMAGGGLVRVENNGDALQPLSASGGFKKLRLTGIHAYSSELLPQLVKLWSELTAECSDAGASMFSIQWESQPTPRPGIDSANSMHDVRFWTNNMIWCKDGSNVEIAQSYLEKVIDVTRRGQRHEGYVDFANSVREPESPVDRRYKDAERLDYLKVLKRKWDADGVFDAELL